MLTSKTLKIRYQILLTQPLILLLTLRLEVKNEIPSIINLATNASLNAKTNEVKGEIPGITNLAAAAAFTTVENKIPNFSDLVKKADYDAEIKDIKNKYFTTSDYNKFMNNILDEKIKADKLVHESVLNEKRNKKQQQRQN